MTIYFKNGENLYIAGQEGEIIKRKISYALEKGLRDWIALYGLEGDMEATSPDFIVNLQEVVAVR